MHIAFVIPPFHGHLNPGSTLAGAVKRLGHRVTLITSLPGQKYAEREGLEFYGLFEKEVEELEAMNKVLATKSGFKAYQITLGIMRRQCQLLLRDLPVALDKLKLDALLIDEILYWPASAAADIKQVPYGTIANAMTIMHWRDGPPCITTWHHSTSWWAQWRNQLVLWAQDVLMPPTRILVNEWLEDQGQPTIADGALRTGGIIQLAQQPAFFEFPKSNQVLPKHFFYTSPWHQSSRDASVSFPFEKLNTNKKIIYASLGTVQNKLQVVYQNICKACAGLDDVQLVVALGKDGASLELNEKEIPEDCIIVGFAPQLQVLRKASMVISHCGMNTCSEAMACGLPALAIPVANDQPGVATRWKSLGAAILIDLPKDADSERIRKSILELLSETSSYKQAAKQLQERLVNESPTLEQTAGLIEIAFGGTDPLLRSDAKVKEFLGAKRVEPVMQQ